MARGPRQSGRRTRVKFCGITRAEDARTAASLGADAVGLIFYPPSPRAVDAARAAEVVAGLAPLVTRVGVFVNPDAEILRAVAGKVPLDLIQFHGEETPEACAALAGAIGRPWIKSVGVRETADVTGAQTRYTAASGLLLDTYSAQKKGGTGRTFDWAQVPAGGELPLLLAGGLGPDNVAAAIAAVHPFAVDANGGVESSPGIKDARKMEAFIREVERAQAA